MRVVYLITLCAAAALLGCGDEQLVQSPRTTFLVSTQDLIDRFNGTIQKPDASIKIPPSKSLPETARNKNFHVRQHKLWETMVVQFEEDNLTGRPFSIGFIGGPGNPAEVGDFLAVIVATSASVFGEGEYAQVLPKMCGKLKTDNTSESVDVGGFTVYCSIIFGVFTGGISAKGEYPKAP